MFYLENLDLMLNELVCNDKYILCINNKYFYIESNPLFHHGLFNLIKEEINEVVSREEEELYEYDIVKLNFELNINKPSNYKKHLVLMYRTFLSLYNKVQDRIEEGLDYETCFNIKVIINNKIFQLEVGPKTNILFRNYINRITLNVVPKSEIIEIEQEYRKITSMI